MVEQGTTLQGWWFYSLWHSSQSLQRNAAFFCDYCGQKKIKYAAYLCDFMRWKLRDLAKNAGTALVWSKRNIFQLSAKIYVTFLQRKCGDYEIMQAPHILRGNLQFMWWECGIFEKMRPLHEYADFGWLCVELCDRIITFFRRDWLVVVSNKSLSKQCFIHCLFRGHYNLTTTWRRNDHGHKWPPNEWFIVYIIYMARSW